MKNVICNLRLLIFRLYVTLIIFNKKILIQAASSEHKTLGGYARCMDLWKGINWTQGIWTIIIYWMWCIYCNKCQYYPFYNDNGEWISGIGAGSSLNMDSLIKSVFTIMPSSSLAKPAMSSLLNCYCDTEAQICG